MTHHVRRIFRHFLLVLAISAVITIATQEIDTSMPLTRDIYESGFKGVDRFSFDNAGYYAKTFVWTIVNGTTTILPLCLINLTSKGTGKILGRDCIASLLEYKKDDPQLAAHKLAYRCFLHRDSGVNLTEYKVRTIAFKGPRDEQGHWMIYFSPDLEEPTCQPVYMSDVGPWALKETLEKHPDLLEEGIFNVAEALPLTKKYFEMSAPVEVVEREHLAAIYTRDVTDTESKILEPLLFCSVAMFAKGKGVIIEECALMLTPFTQVDPKMRNLLLAYKCILPNSTDYKLVTTPILKVEKVDDMHSIVYFKVRKTRQCTVKWSTSGNALKELHKIAQDSVKKIKDEL